MGLTTLFSNRALGAANSRDRRFSLALLGVALVALLARTIYLAVHGAVDAPDTKDYLELAANLLRGHGFSMDATAPYLPSIRRPPVYPLFLALFGWAGSYQTVAVAAFQIAADVLVTIGIILAVRSVASPTAALGAGAVYALHPGIIANCSIIMSECLFAALLAGGLGLAGCGIKQQKPWVSALAGVVLGAAILCRAVALLLLPLFALALLFFPKLPRRARHAVAIVGAAALVVAPWAVRCTLAAGQPVLVQGTSGVMLYVATRYDWNQLDQTQVWHGFDQAPEVRALGVSLGTLSRGNTAAEVARSDRELTRISRQRIQAAPAAYLRSRLRAWPYLCLTSYDTIPGSERAFGDLLRGRQWLPLAAKAASFLLLSILPLALGLVGLLQSRQSFIVLCCAIIWVYTAVVYLPMWIEPRYWLPAIPFLWVSAAIGLDYLVQKLSARAHQPGLTAGPGTRSSE